MSVLYKLGFWWVIMYVLYLMFMYVLSMNIVYIVKCLYLWYPFGDFIYYPGVPFETFLMLGYPNGDCAFLLVKNELLSIIINVKFMLAHCPLSKGIDECIMASFSTNTR